MQKSKLPNCLHCIHSKRLIINELTQEIHCTSIYNSGLVGSLNEKPDWFELTACKEYKTKTI